MAACLFLAGVSAGGANAEPDAPAPFEARLPAAAFELPMVMRGPLPAVEVAVNGEGPFVFLIDTGGQGVARIDQGLVEELKLPRIGTARAGDGSGQGTIEMSVVDVASIEVGGLSLRHAHAGSRDYARTFPPEMQPVHGIICWDAFKGCTLTLDYLGRKVRVAPGGCHKPETGAMRIDSDVEVAATTMVVNGKDIDADIDTGAMGGVQLPKSIVEGLKIVGSPRVVAKARTATGEFEILEAAIEGEICLGALTMKNPTIAFADRFEFANIGSRFLNSYVATFDRVRGLMWIDGQPSGSVPVAAAGAGAITEQVLLDRMRGECDVHVRLYPPGGDVKSASGRATWSLRVDGKLHESFSMVVDGRTLEGEVYFGPNRMRRGYDLVQVDTFNPEMIMVWGQWDAASSSLRLSAVDRLDGSPVQGQIVWVYRAGEGSSWVKEMRRRMPDGSEALMSDYTYLPRS